MTEVGYHFRLRTAGATKLSGSVITAYLTSVAELVLARLAASGFVTYGLIALLGAVIRSSVLAPALGSTGGSPIAPGTGIPVTALLAAEVAVVVEYLAHDRASFAPWGHRRWRHAGPLVRFHLVAGQATLAVAGADRLVGQLVLPAGGPEPTVIRLLVALGLTTVALVGTVVASFLVNRQVTWPYRSRPTTWPTSSSISATARR